MGAVLDEKLEDERRLIAEAQGGNIDAMQPLFEQFAGPLYGTVILPRLGNPTTAEDVLRDTFSTAIEKLDKFTWQGRSIYGWLRQIAINKVFDAHRSSQRSRRLAEAIARDTTTVTSVATDGADALLIAEQERQRNRERIDDALGRISERYRTAIELRLIHEHTREDCADKMGVTLGNFDVLLHRAVRAFRKHFGDREPS